MNLGDEHDYNMPNALFLADVLERSAQSHTQANAAAEMRRLHAENESLRAALAEPVQEPVAWIHTDPDNRRVKFLEWRENEPGYRGDWIKTPLYAAPSSGRMG